MSLINQCSAITCAQIILFILQVNGKTEDNHCVNEGQIIRYDEEDQSIHWNNLKTPYKYELTINDKPPIITNETTFNVGDDIPSCSDVKILLRTVDKDDKFGNVFCVEYELQPDPPHNFQITVKENWIVATWETPPNMEVCGTETYQIQTRGKAINVTEQKYVFDYIPYCYNMDIQVKTLTANGHYESGYSKITGPTILPEITNLTAVSGTVSWEIVQNTDQCDYQIKIDNYIIDNNYTTSTLSIADFDKGIVTCMLLGTANCTVTPIHENGALGKSETVSFEMPVETADIFEVTDDETGLFVTWNEKYSPYTVGIRLNGRLIHFVNTTSATLEDGKFKFCKMYDIEANILDYSGNVGKTQTLSFKRAITWEQTDFNIFDTGSEVIVSWSPDLDPCVMTIKVSPGNHEYSNHGNGKPLDQTKFEYCKEYKIGILITNNNVEEFSHHISLERDVVPGFNAISNLTLTLNGTDDKMNIVAFGQTDCDLEYYFTCIVDSRREQFDHIKSKQVDHDKSFLATQASAISHKHLRVHLVKLITYCIYEYCQCLNEKRSDMK